MALFDPDLSQTWLFCFTHPDDEVAIAAWIRRLSSAGAPVWMSWTHRTGVREREARAAADAIGVPQDRLLFHAGTDGRMCEEMGDLIGGFREMIATVRPDVVCCCAFEQGHLDHDATNRLVHAAWHGPVLEFPMYHTYRVALQVIGRFADPYGEERLALTDEERRWKTRLLDVYPSQTIKRNAIWYQRLAWLIGREADLLSHERLRRQTHTDFARPNLPSPLRERVEASRPWGRWLVALQAFESRSEP